MIIKAMVPAVATAIQMIVLFHQSSISPKFAKVNVVFGGIKIGPMSINFPASPI